MYNKKAGHTEGDSFDSPAVFFQRPVAFRALANKGSALSGMIRDFYFTSYITRAFPAVKLIF